MLNIALASRSFGKLPSELLGIADETLALDFNLACSFRLFVFDNDRDRDRFNALSRMLGGGGESDDDDGETITV